MLHREDPELIFAPQEVESPTRAAGFPSMKHREDPVVISVLPCLRGLRTGQNIGSPTRAAGLPSIRQLEAPSDILPP